MIATREHPPTCRLGRGVAYKILHHTSLETDQVGAALNFLMSFDFQFTAYETPLSKLAVRGCFFKSCIYVNDGVTNRWLIWIHRISSENLHLLEYSFAFH